VTGMIDNLVEENRRTIKIGMAKKKKTEIRTCKCKIKE
jgi:hypothetical protein